MKLSTAFSGLVLLVSTGGALAQWCPSGVPGTEVLLDFGTSANGVTSAGDFADALTWPNGVDISAVATSPAGLRAMLFDTNNPTGNDQDDLMQGVGNVLIVSMDNDPSDPNDNNGGGTLQFIFTQPYELVSMQLLDNDENGGNAIQSLGGGAVSTQPLPNTGNAGTEVFSFDSSALTNKLDIVLAGSGAIGNLKYCIPDPPTDPPTEAPTPGSYGDPHFHTWHDQDFEFHGGCDLVMLKAPVIDLDIHMRTTIQFDYSYISEVAVRMGEDVFQVASFGEYMLNDIDSIDFPFSVGGHRVSLDHPNKKTYSFTIDMDNGVAIQVNAFKHFVSVKIKHGAMELFHNASGMMGHFETMGGDMLARDGVSLMDLNEPNKIGAEWQVRPDEDGTLFNLNRAPQYPIQCELPAVSNTRARKLGEAISNEVAQDACSGVSNDSRRKNCIKDVIKTGDKEIAESY